MEFSRRVNPCENYCKPFSAQCQLGILISPWKSRIAVGFQNVPLFASDEMLVRKESSFIQGKLILGVIYSLLFLFLSPHLLLSSLHLYRFLSQGRVVSWFYTYQIFVESHRPYRTAQLSYSVVGGTHHAVILTFLRCW